MTKKILAFLLCLSLAMALSACAKETAAPKTEESGGTGFGTARGSSLVEQDLYFLRPGAAREDVETALGSPHSFILTDGNGCTYRLAGGEKLRITYSDEGLLEEARYTDGEGGEQNFFTYLNSLGILLNYESEDGEQPAPEPDKPEEPQKPQQDPYRPITDSSYYFSIKRYSYTLAEQVLKEGVLRETVLSALGKPNAYSSIDFKADGYIIDVYQMEDGSTLYLDYGYTRKVLRAAEKVEGGVSSDYLGKWGAEQKPDGLYRGNRNRNLFNTLQKNAKPSEIYRKLGEPDWLEGRAEQYMDAYQLQDGGVIYLDFGSNHATLASVILQKPDGSKTPLNLR
ncbi:MAG: hypothetical protein IJN34_08600 [Clostridia bacterium]|nr:hypothetical protein [Clostridia bacterium]